MKIKEQTRKLAAGCSKNRFEVADEAERGLKRFSKSINRFEFDFRRVLVQTAVVVIILHGFNFAKKVTISDLREEVMVGSSC
ncbi:chlorohydrolase [Streptococcus pneumoniae]|nr:chlorohydrolase [Streptococcus pneumoniae]